MWCLCLVFHGGCVCAYVYVGACHKWMCAPKGTSFLYVKKDLQPMIDPLVVSWGYESEEPSHSQFLDYHQWQGTRDMSAFLTLPSVISFLKQHNWEKVSKQCKDNTIIARKKINDFRIHSLLFLCLCISISFAIVLYSSH